MAAKLSSLRHVSIPDEFSTVSSCFVQTLLFLSPGCLEGRPNGAFGPHSASGFGEDLASVTDNI